ncbi:MAG: DUF4071 domain-containing protein [Pyrinomonadaceae bacterium]|nr:DUF4071 domain-containing protein [Pyrinomonadaceae bacterium]
MDNQAEPVANVVSEAVEAESPEKIGRLSVTELFKLWQSHDVESRSKNYDLYRTFASRAVNLGEPLLAYDAVREGLETWTHDVRLRQLHALALARSGATLRARSILTELQQEGHRDEETLGILARTHKDLWLQAPETDAGRENLRRAQELYLEAYRINEGYWTGINAATLALLLGHRDVAEDVAEKVSKLCLRELERAEETGANKYWPLATLGEAALIRGEWDEAERRYAEASEAAKGEYAEVASTRRNARLIAKAMGESLARVDSFFDIPGVVIFTGHMIDSPERDRPRFPPELESAVKDAIRERLLKLNAGFGYSSAACGSDILFLEVMNEIGGKTHVVLPYERDQFIEDSVRGATHKGWKERFEAVMSRASSVTVASHYKLEGGDASYEYANQLIHGLAIIKAAQLETEILALAVWDGGEGDGRGGTRSAIDEWQQQGLKIDLINPAKMLREGVEPEVSALSDAHKETSAEVEEGALKPKIMSMLFADAVNFSRLTERQMPLFLQHFLGLIGESVRTAQHLPVLKNTWGDGLFFVFSSVREAGDFALELSQRLCRTNWAEKGLPEDLNLRIALHAGPVYSCTDPITERPNLFGTHVTRAARLEPITPPGLVYSSQEFAALAAAQGVTDFKCEYIGQTPLAKKYGTFPTYHVYRVKI